MNRASWRRRGHRVHDRGLRRVARPVLFALYVRFRPYAETNQYGYVSLPHHLTFANYLNAWTQSDMRRFFLNSVLITVPAVILTLLLATWSPSWSPGSTLRSTLHCC